MAWQVYPNCRTKNFYVVQKDDTISSIAKYFNVTEEKILLNNFGIDPNNLFEGMYLCIPLAPLSINIEISTSEHKLRVFRNGEEFKSYFVALGKKSTQTPKGKFIILNKNPDFVISGFGTRQMGLSAPNLIICGTKNEDIIGTNATSGNIVMKNSDINELFNLVPVNTEIRID